MSALLVPYDFSAHAEAALESARNLAPKLGADLHLLHVVPRLAYATGGSEGLPLTASEDLRADAERMLLRVAASVDNGPRRVETWLLDGGDVVDAICRTAREIGADFIVMGTHGRTGLAHALLGSVTELTLRQAPCPVVTVRSRPTTGG
jgi:universal stress protein A